MQFLKFLLAAFIEFAILDSIAILIWNKTKEKKVNTKILWYNFFLGFFSLSSLVVLSVFA